MLEPSALHGIVPPIVTPLTPDGEVDHRSLASACRFLLASGVHGLWAAGTTGEFPCFTAGERAEIVQTCVAAAGGRVPVVANVGDCSTKLAVGPCPARCRGRRRRPRPDATLLLPE